MAMLFHRTRLAYNVPQGASFAHSFKAPQQQHVHNVLTHFIYLLVLNLF